MVSNAWCIIDAAIWICEGHAQLLMVLSWVMRAESFRQGHVQLLMGGSGIERSGPCVKYSKRSSVIVNLFCMAHR